MRPLRTAAGTALAIALGCGPLLTVHPWTILAADPVDQLPPLVMEPEAATPQTTEATPEATPLPTPEATPEPAPIETPAEAALPEPTPEPAPDSAQEATPAETEAPEPGIADAQPAPRTDDDRNDEALLESPTRSVDEYEAARSRRLHKTSVPDWSFNLTIAPKAFRLADLRATAASTVSSELKPSLFGILLSFEKMLVKETGSLSIGVEAGTYGATSKDKFSGLTLAFLAGGPYAQYQAHFVPNQWVVPTARFEYELVRYSYKVEGQAIRGQRFLPRFDVGLMVFLNVLEPSSAGQMSSNYGIKRTYLAAYYSLARDSKKEHFDLSENSVRACVRFEY